MSNHTHADMVGRMISMSLGKEKPTREVIDWYRHARAEGNLSAWDRSAVQYALSGSDDPMEQCYQTEFNVFMLRGLVHRAYDIDPRLSEVDTETLDELREELRMISEWNDAFDEVEQCGGSFTSEEMLRAMR